MGMMSQNGWQDAYARVIQTSTETRMVAHVDCPSSQKRSGLIRIPRIQEVLLKCQRAHVVVAVVQGQLAQVCPFMRGPVVDDRRMHHHLRIGLEVLNAAILLLLHFLVKINTKGSTCTQLCMCRH